MWEAFQEPEPSSDDELDTEEGEVNTPGSSVGTQRARDGRTEATRDPPLSAPPAFASTSTNAVVGDNSRSQMKRKEFESLFTSKKRTRYVPETQSDQDDVMDLDLGEHPKYMKYMRMNSKPAPEQKTMGGRASLSVSSTTMNRKLGNNSAPPINAKPKLMRKSSGMKPPPFPRKNLSNSTMAESIRPATRDPPSKLAGLLFDTYKSAESKTMPASDPGRSVVSASPVNNKLAKAPLKRQRVPSASQTTRQLSTSKSQAPSEADIIVISDDDDSPPPSISQAKSKSKSIKPFLSAPAQVRQGSRTSKSASGSAFRSATKGFLPKPKEVIEILDSDDELEQFLSKAKALLPERSVDRSSSGGLPESSTGSNPRRDQSPHISALGGEGSDGNADVMIIDGGDLFNIPSSPGALSPELHVDDDDEQLFSKAKAQLPEKNVDRSSSGRLPESSTGSNPRRDQSRHVSALGGEGSDGNADAMIIDGGDLFNIPSSPGALSQELQVDDDDTNDNRDAQLFIPLPSSSPSSVGLSPKDNYLSTPPAPTSPITSLSMSLPRRQSFPLPTRTNYTKKPITASPSIGTSTGSPSNRQGFSSVAIPSSLQAPPPADKHRRQFARKMAIQVMPDEDEDTGESKSSESEGTASIKASKGKEKEGRESLYSSSGTESTSMRGLRNALAMDSDKLKQRLVSSNLPKKQGQTLAEVITSAGQLNRTKKMRRRVERNEKDVPVDPRSDDETGINDGPAADENEKALKAAIGSSRLLVNLLPALKEKTSVRVATAATAAKVSSPPGEKLPLSPSPTQDFQAKLVPPESPSTKTEGSSYSLTPLFPNPNIVTHDVPSEKPLLSLEMKLDSESSVGKIFETTSQPKTELSTAFEFKSGTAMIIPQKTADLLTIQTTNSPLSIHPPASSPIVPASFNDAAVQDESFHTLGLPSDDSRDDDEEECKSLLQSPNMDVIPNDDEQTSLQDSIVVRHKSPIDLDTSVATPPSLIESLSATTEVFNENARVSPPIPEVQTRRSSRLSSNRSSRSTSSEGFGIAFGFDSGPSNSVPVSRVSSPEVQNFSALPSAKTYGGFRALTWKDFRKDLKNFTPKTYYAKDLPHSLQDHINSMSEYTQMMEGMRDLFKATILENTVEDEPDAPPIEIWNSVDTQATPPWEFYYTNNMWLGEGVPPPDIKTLISCTCKGGCNPKSKTCACLLRQREAVGDPQLEFAYDKNGRLKIPGYPIFECNDLCGCSDECRNRVVQQGRKFPVSIGKTEMKGWGVFAGSRKIPEGTFLGIYSGELLTDAEAQERGIKYNKSGRTYLFDIDFHHLKDGSPSWENSFTVDAYHAGNFTRFLNHSCDPNCRLYACYVNEGNIQKPLLTVFTRRDIEPYEEICFNYQGKYDDVDDEDDDDEDDDDDDRNPDLDHLKDMIYVRCQCGAKNCTGTMFK